MKKVIASWLCLFAVLACCRPCSGDDDSIPSQIKLLKHPDSKVRLKAATELRQAGTKAKAAVPALISALKDEKKIREIALEALIAVGPASVPALARALGDQDPRVRHGVLDVLEHFGPQAKDAVPALHAALHDQDKLIRVKIVQILGATRDPASINALLDRLKNDKDLDVRRFAARSLGCFGPAAKEAIPALVAAIDEAAKMPKDTGDMVGGVQGGSVSRLIEWSSGLKTLSCLGLAGIGEPAVPVVMKMLEDKDRKFDALYILNLMGPNAQAAVPKIAEMLGDQDQWIKQDAARTLAGLGPKAKLAIPDLTRALRDRSGNTRVWAAYALRKINPQDKDGIVVLSQGVRDRDADVRLGAISLLREKDVRPEPAIPALIEAVNDENERVRCEAIWTLRELGRSAKPAVREPAVRAIAGALKDSSKDVRRTAVKALIRTQHGDVAVPALIQSLNDPDERVHLAAIFALGAHGKEAKVAVPALIRELESEFRESAEAALKRIDPEAARKAGVK